MILTYLTKFIHRSLGVGPTRRRRHPVHGRTRRGTYLLLGREQSVFIAFKDVSKQKQGKVPW